MSASNNLPFLVGHRFTDPYKTSYHKNQAFVLSQNPCIEKPFQLEKIDPFTINSLKTFTSTFTADRLKSRETPVQIQLITTSIPPMVYNMLSLLENAWVFCTKCDMIFKKCLTPGKEATIMIKQISRF